MNTQSHVIIGAALLGRAMPKRAWVAAAGGLLPDMPMILIVITLQVLGYSSYQIFDEMYWQNWWQISNGIAHNFWLWGGLALLSIVMKERLSASAASIERWAMTLVFSLSTLLHAGIDFLCHREDAHMSLWPVTRWKFMSPVSYYDRAHYGNYFSLFEAALCLCLAIVLVRQFQNKWVRGALGLAMLMYVAVPAFFFFSFD